MSITEERRRARFWAKVNKEGPVQSHLQTKCWLWTGAASSNGHGAFKVGGRQEVASRYSLALALGRPIRPGYQANHRCDNPPCVNPEHIYEGTQQENLDEMYERGRGPTGERNGSHTTPGCHSGERNGRSKLTWSEVDAIRRLHSEEGLTGAELGRRYGVSKVVACDIIRGKNWKESTRATTHR